MEPSPGIGLGRPVKRALQFSDLVCLGGPSHDRGTHRALPCTSRVNEAAALPSPAVVLSARLKQYYGRLRRPPGTRPLPGSSPVIGRDAPTAHFRRRPGRGGPPQFPSSPSERSTPSTPGSSSGLQFQALDPFHGLHPTGRGSALPDTRSRRGRLRLMLRTARSHTPNGMLDAALRPRRVSPPKPAACYRASWQLPGPDLPRQATTSLSLNHDVLPSTSNRLGALP